LFVCPLAQLQKPNNQTSFLCVWPVAVARSFSDGVVLDIIARWRYQLDFNVRQLQCLWVVEMGRRAQRLLPTNDCCCRCYYAPSQTIGRWHCKRCCDPRWSSHRRRDCALALFAPCFPVALSSAGTGGVSLRRHSSNWVALLYALSSDEMSSDKYVSK